MLKPFDIFDLENIIERAVILAQKDKFLDVRHFGNFEPAFYDGLGLNDGRDTLNATNINSLNIKEMEEKLILAALKETGGNKTKAAEKLGITSRTLRNKLKELGIN